jgi:hypothetical protein
MSTFSVKKVVESALQMISDPWDLELYTHAKKIFQRQLSKIPSDAVWSFANKESLPKVEKSQKRRRKRQKATIQ